MLRRGGGSLVEISVQAWQHHVEHTKQIPSQNRCQQDYIHGAGLGLSANGLPHTIGPSTRHFGCVYYICIDLMLFLHFLLSFFKRSKRASVALFLVLACFIPLDILCAFLLLLHTRYPLYSHHCTYTHIYPASLSGMDL